MGHPPLSSCSLLQCSIKVASCLMVNYWDFCFPKTMCYSDNSSLMAKSHQLLSFVSVFRPVIPAIRGARLNICFSPKSRDPISESECEPLKGIALNSKPQQSNFKHDTPGRANQLFDMFPAQPSF